MVKKTVSRAEFARLANVSAAAVTKACNSFLKGTLTGKRIDVAHPDAVKYIESKTQPRPESAVIGIDPVYEQAVDFCQSTGRYSGAGLQREFKIGYERARKIIATMTISGLVPVDNSETVVTKPAIKPHVRGTAAAREKKKLTPPPEVPRNDDGIIEIPEDIEQFADFTVREIVEKFGTESRFIDYLAAVQKIEAINEKRLKNAQTKGLLISRELVQKGVIDTFNSAHLRLLKDGAKSIAAGAISKHASGAELAEVEEYVTDILGSFIKPVKSKIIRILKEV